jgi:ribosomal-protein-alanine N-acetyltransferase
MIYSEEPVRRFLITAPASREAFGPLFQAMMAQSGGGHLWGVEDKGSNALIGRCGFYLWEGDLSPPEFAVLLTQTIWGRGLASEATRACLDFAFHEMGWTKVTAVARPANAAVRRLLKRAGFREDHETELRGGSALWFSALAGAGGFGGADGRDR